MQQEGLALRLRQAGDPGAIPARRRRSPVGQRQGNDLSDTPGTAGDESDFAGEIDLLGEGVSAFGIGDRVVVDGPLITSRGPGTAIEWALAIVAAIAGPAATPPAPHRPSGLLDDRRLGRYPRRAERARAAEW